MLCPGVQRSKRGGMIVHDYYTILTTNNGKLAFNLGEFNGNLVQLLVWSIHKELVAFLW